MKQKVLYHGSSKRLIGKKLVPKKADDLEKHLDNLHKAVYATDIKKSAMAMAIISCKGVHSASLNMKKEPYGTIYKGFPKQEYIYLYSLPKETFVKSPNIKHQFISEVSVKPLKIEKLKVKDYLDLIRKATKKEKEVWMNKYEKL